MKAATARRLNGVRIALLAAFFACFLYLLLRAGDPGLSSWLARGIFFAFDPLILLEHLAATRTVLTFSLLGLVPLALTFVFGRFFCGWVCPFGAANEFLSWMLKRKRKTRAGPDLHFLRPKYLLLVAILAAALLGTPLGGWLDPFALLTRSVASVQPAFASVLPGNGFHRVSAQPVLIGSLLLLLLALNAWKRRFFCNALCPLGALYGLAARFRLLRLEPKEECTACNTCDARCPYGGGPGEEHLNSECILCLHCVADCPGDGVAVGFFRPTRGTATGVDLGRRRVLGSAVAGLAVALLPMGAIEARPKAGHRFLRPPGALGESEFLDRCARCGQCVQSCPTSFVQPALLEAGFEGIWTPVLDARAGYCDYSCNRCTLACPTGAIAPLDMARKQAWKVGTAVVDRNLCYTHADGFNCTACADKCPIPEKPLRFRDVEMLDFRGKRVSVRQLYVVPDLCTGCGICEYVCPRKGSPGIFMTAEDEAREAVG